MTLKLDKLGRFVVPKSFRDRFLLKPGDELEVFVESDGIKLSPRKPTPATVAENGILVCASEVPSSTWEIPAFLDQQRENRSQGISHL
ncbi:MAG: AbrB/MazE/SpoVT family DNA-binding domain-containing protein [Verrucomicrobia bacterium]|jgi:AbrB family looped-hinge helix DNA binding protein|nr:AbrB/MazE/SpoVT family DNA-binding domain-containing protein [Verrucomicrobiota bacterium]MDA7510104.1 AbrB/MazE/SpoVT family DNA-binding domain-containing protein [Verrucomicrobiota bacterium]